MAGAYYKLQESPSQGNTSSEELGLKPTKADRKKFDLDLSRGEWGEEQVAKFLVLTKIRLRLRQIGSFSILVILPLKRMLPTVRQVAYLPLSLSIGYTSLLSMTKYFALYLSTDKLKKIVDMGIWRKTNGGDHYASTMHLINLSKTGDPLTIEMYSNQTKGDT